MQLPKPPLQPGLEIPGVRQRKSSSILDSKFKKQARGSPFQIMGFVVSSTVKKVEKF
jgi:hypothetical protein